MRRRRFGKGFSYLDPSGRTVRDKAVKARIKALAIPPAWTDVWSYLRNVLNDCSIADRIEPPAATLKIPSVPRTSNQLISRFKPAAFMASTRMRVDCENT